MNYLSYYLEEGSVDTAMFSHVSLSKDILQDIKESFIESGGVWIQTDVKLGIRFVISKWTDIDGYNKWLNHSKTKEYLLIRDKYNKTNNITSRVITILPEKS